MAWKNTKSTTPRAKAIKATDISTILVELPTSSRLGHDTLRNSA